MNERMRELLLQGKRVYMSKRQFGLHLVEREFFFVAGKSSDFSYSATERIWEDMIASCGKK
jgi:hypothetical protein